MPSIISMYFPTLLTIPASVPVQSRHIQSEGISRTRLQEWNRIYGIDLLSNLVLQKIIISKVCLTQE
jgi:hypothetical protein